MRAAVFERKAGRGRGCGAHVPSVCHGSEEGGTEEKGRSGTPAAAPTSVSGLCRSLKDARVLLIVIVEFGFGSQLLDDHIRQAIEEKASLRRFEDGQEGLLNQIFFVTL